MSSHLLPIVHVFVEASRPEDFLLVQSGKRNSFELTILGNGQARVWMPSIRGSLGDNGLELLKARFGPGLVMEGEANADRD